MSNTATHRQSVGAVISHREVIRAASGAPEWRDCPAMRTLVNLKRTFSTRKQCLRNIREDVQAVGVSSAILPVRNNGLRACAKACELDAQAAARDEHRLPADLIRACEEVCQ